MVCVAVYTCLYVNALVRKNSTDTQILASRAFKNLCNWLFGVQKYFFSVEGNL